MHTIDPTMSFAQVVQYYKDYVKRTRSLGRKPVSFLRFVTGRYQKSDDKAGYKDATGSHPTFLFYSKISTFQKTTLE